MRGKVAFVFAAAVFTSQGVFTNAAEEEAAKQQPPPAKGANMPLGVPTPENQAAAAGQLKTLFESQLFQDILGKLGPVEPDATLDASFFQRAIQSLSGLASPANLSDLLSILTQDPNGALQGLLKLEDDEEEYDDGDMLNALQMYFMSFNNVLHGNDYLRNQVTSLMKQNAERLINNGTLVDVLGDIVSSEVLADLKEEIEDDIERSGVALPHPDTGDEMSR